MALSRGATLLSITKESQLTRKTRTKNTPNGCYLKLLIRIHDVFFTAYIIGQSFFYIFEYVF